MTNKLEFSRGDVIAKKYEVVDLLDESPLGLTYRVKHGESGKYVRLLVLRPRVANRDAKEQLIRCFKEAKGGKHDNLIKLGELGEHQGLAYVTMEDFDGTTLRELIQEYKIQGKPFDVKEAAQITIQILEGVEAAKDAGFVFRALRPEYVLVKTRRTGPRKQNFVANVKLIGVGFWDLVPSAILAEDEFSRGEAQYIAPELKSFEPRPTERCDVYSSGVMFYEMVVGTAPVGTFQLPKTKRPDLPDHVNNVAELALAHSPEDRYQTARDFIIDIQRIFDGSAEESKSNLKLLTPIVAIAMIMAMFLIVAVAIILFNLRPDPVKVAEAEDATARNAVVEQVRSGMPTETEIKAILQNHPQNMAYVPGGPYLSGALRMEKFDKNNSLAQPTEPVNEVVDVKGFVIDLFEFPNFPNTAPTLELTQEQAAKECENVGKRLCTSDEWEKACKGPQMYAYSYGDTFDPDFCGNGLDETYRSGARQNCRSGWGAFDMSGNFREWTSTPQVGSTNRVEVKGGVRAAAEKGTRCAFSKDERTTYSDKSIGFRCCRDADAPKWEPPADGEKKPE
ncbi:MAG: SUMF1/EgtB/PvdO family nonheme iron enzyme [Alphaproteobacteria bacterium]|nr:SUMF1/EgtB/PvdO family nonheme iron enzyme [Alphaproteobacteria bacterium]